MVGFSHMLYALEGGHAGNTFPAGALYYFFLLGADNGVPAEYATEGEVTQILEKDRKALDLSIFVFLGIMSFVFSVWILNLFITAIGDAYAKEKEKASLTFRKAKCEICLTYLLRASVLPSRLCCIDTDSNRMRLMYCLAIIFMSGLLGCTSFDPDVLGPNPFLIRFPLLVVLLLFLEVGLFYPTRAITSNIF